MKVKILLNGTMREAEISSDQLLIDFVRDHGCYSVKRGCETSNCGLCTVFVDDKPVLSCSMLTARVEDFRKKQKNSVHLLQIRVQNSAVSAIRE